VGCAPSVHDGYARVCHSLKGGSRRTAQGARLSIEVIEMIIFRKNPRAVFLMSTISSSLTLPIRGCKSRVHR